MAIESQPGHEFMRAANTAEYGLTPEQLAEVEDHSSMSYEEAVLNGLRPDCPPEILERQRVLEVYYHGFDGKIHRGQIVVDQDVVEDIEGGFVVAFKNNFPIRTVIPVSHFGWDDNYSMDRDNSSGFNYRTIATTNTLSLHARGLAVDINTRLNPYTQEDGVVMPPGAVYKPGEPGVLVEGDPIVSYFKKKGWVWGGDWKRVPDYQHFEKEV